MLTCLSAIEYTLKIQEFIEETVFCA